MLDFNNSCIYLLALLFSMRPIVTQRRYCLVSKTNTLLIFVAKRMRSKAKKKYWKLFSSLKRNIIILNNDTNRFFHYHHGKGSG